MNSKLLVLFFALSLFVMPTLIYAHAPALGSVSNFALFTSDGAFSNIGDQTVVTGNVGNHVGQFTAFTPGILYGEKHIADAVSTSAALDVATAYSDLFSLTCGEVIDTLLGTNQRLIPKVYCIGSASTLKGDLILDGEGNPNAIFVFKINGALSVATHSNVVLTNSASLKNIYWQIGGAFSLGDSSVFRGTIIADGALNLLEGSSLSGRGLSKAGAISLHNNVVTLVSNFSTGLNTLDFENKVNIISNSSVSTVTVVLSETSKINNYYLKMYNLLGSEVVNEKIISQSTTLNSGALSTGIYIFKVMENNLIIQTGKFIY